jgi:hypothetical protein
MKRAFLPLVLVFLVGLFAGCASYQASHHRNLEGLRHYFVLTNANDNRALDHQIAGALHSRGLAAGTGPLTMMPDETQAIVTYQDQWTWDFGDHLVYLQVTVRDRKSNQTLASATFSTRLPTRTPTSGIVDGLVGKLLEGGKR